MHSLQVLDIFKEGIHSDHLKFFENGMGSSRRDLPGETREENLNQNTRETGILNMKTREKVDFLDLDMLRNECGR